VAEGVERRHRVDRAGPQGEPGHVGPDERRRGRRLPGQPELHRGQVHADHPVPVSEQARRRLPGSAPQVHDGAVIREQVQQGADAAGPDRARPRPLPVPRAERVVPARDHLLRRPVHRVSMSTGAQGGTSIVERLDDLDWAA
jgi:hypothetical protein